MSPQISIPSKKCFSRICFQAKNLNMSEFAVQKNFLNNFLCSWKIIPEGKFGVQKYMNSERNGKLMD